MVDLRRFLEQQMRDKREQESKYKEEAINGQL